MGLWFIKVSLGAKGRRKGKQRGPLLLFEHDKLILCMQYDDEHGVHELPQHLLQLSDHGAHAVRGQPGEGLLPGGQRRTSRLPGYI